MKILKTLKNLFFATCVVFITVATPISSYAQLKIQDLSSIENEAKKGADTAKNIALSVIGAVLVIALIFVVWEIASGKPNGKEHLIAWFIAVVVVIIAGMIV